MNMKMISTWTGMYMTLPSFHCFRNPILCEGFKVLKPGIQSKEQRRTFCYDGRQSSGPKRTNSTSKRKPAGKSSGKTAVVETVERSKRGPRKGVQQGFQRRLVDSELPELDGLPLPKPPAGFMVDNSGRVVLMAPPEKRTAVIVDPANERPLECMVRRIFSSSRGEQCWLLCPLDTPLQILRIGENGGLSALSDEEIEEVIPSAAYALAKRHMHLVLSGFCYTARGGFCYSEEDIIELDTEYDQSLGGSLAEGVEVTGFQVEGSEFLIFIPFDPLLFVAVKDDKGDLRIAEDDLLDDSLVLDAIDEEKEFQAFVEGEAAVVEALKKE